MALKMSRLFGSRGRRLPPKMVSEMSSVLTSGPRPREPGDPVMLHFHGGGYLCGTAAETDLTSSIAKSLVIHSPVHHILSVDYRLAPKAPWPLPLLDAISSYWYLLQQGIEESDIIVVGDSAGGHLGMALVRWLRDEGPGLGLNGPRGLVLMSPWCDVGFTHAWGEGANHNADSDTVSQDLATLRPDRHDIWAFCNLSTPSSTPSLNHAHLELSLPCVLIASGSCHRQGLT
jgi:acetyl esterase/lipase